MKMTDDRKKARAAGRQAARLRTELKAIPVGPPSPAPEVEPEPASEEAELAIRILEARRLRERLFGAELFGDPAWDMMLDLFVNADRGTPVSTTSLCQAAKVPSTTALRWINMLVEAGLFIRSPDHGDARRNFVRLAPKAEARMRDYLRVTRAMVMSLDDIDD